MGFIRRPVMSSLFSEMYLVNANFGFNRKDIEIGKNVSSSTFTL